MKGKELAIKYLSLRSRTICEMRKYLIEKGQTPEDVDIIVQELMEIGYLNDEKYARDYVLYGRRKNRGQIRISRELNDKGIKPEIFEAAIEFVGSQEALDNLDPYSERRRAEELALGWAKGYEIDDKLLRKVARKLETLGYDGDTIYGSIGALMALGRDDHGSD